MSDHSFELLIIVSNLLVTLPTIILAFITFFAIQKEDRAFLLAVMTLHLRRARRARRGPSV